MSKELLVPKGRRSLSLWLITLLPALALALFIACIPGPDEGTSGDDDDATDSDAPVDILWVIDDSNSMESIQTALRADMNTLFSQLADAGLDFQAGVTTTDIVNVGNGKQGNIRSAGGSHHGWLAHIGEPTDCAEPVIISNENPAPDALFSDLADVGVTGSGSETGLLAAAYALCKGMDEQFWADLSGRSDDDPIKMICGQLPEENRLCNNGFFRPDALSVVVIVSDEGDDAGRHSSLPPTDFLTDCESEHQGEADYGECDCRLEWFLEFFTSISESIRFVTVSPTYQSSTDLLSCAGSTVSLPGPCNEFGSTSCTLDFYQQAACRTGGLFSPIKATTTTDDPGTCELSDFGDLAEKVRDLLL